MKQIGDAIGIELSKTAVQFETSWDSEDNILTIYVRKVITAKKM